MNGKMRNEIMNVETIHVMGGAKGKIEFYANKAIKIVWSIPPKLVKKQEYSFSNELVEIRVKFENQPKNLVVLTTFIKPEFDRVKGIRQGIESYYVKIKSKGKCFKISTPYEKAEDMKVNLCRHPSKNRSKHGAKMGISQVYKAGGMTPK